MTTAIKVYCPRCQRSSREHAFSTEHVSSERRCPQPARNGRGLCNGRLSIHVNHLGAWK